MQTMKKILQLAIFIKILCTSFKLKRLQVNDNYVEAEITECGIIRLRIQINTKNIGY